jgi:shikimate kinase
MDLKLKRTPAIYLVGFMGSGKTTIGRMLADKLGWPFVDLDDEIEAEQKTTIADIFETRGEAAFRQMETEALRRRVRMIQSGRPMVVALGGGAFVQPENFELTFHSGVTVWLDCPLARACSRVEKENHRPLARDPGKFEQLYHARRQAYARAEYRIEIVGDDPAEAVNAILKLPVFD